MTALILASASTHRAQLLKNVGLDFQQQAADIDERAVDAPLEEAGLPPEDRAQILAEAKAMDVSSKNPDAVVIGCDQILSLGGNVLHKVTTMEDARRRLLTLAGREHHLHTALALATGGRTIFRHTVRCDMVMRDMSPESIGRYLASVGDAVFSSVGCYQIEAEGIRLFERIEGDYHAIIGLPLLPLLKALRDEGVIDG